MAGLLAIFAEFEREILRERTKAGLAHCRSETKPWLKISHPPISPRNNPRPICIPLVTLIQRRFTQRYRKLTNRWRGDHQGRETHLPESATSIRRYSPRVSRKLLETLVGAA